MYFHELMVYAHRTERIMTLESSVDCVYQISFNLSRELQDRGMVHTSNKVHINMMVHFMINSCLDHQWQLPLIFHL